MAGTVTVALPGRHLVADCHLPGHRLRRRTRGCAVEGGLVMAGQVSSPALAAAMGKALAAAGLSSLAVADAVADAVREFADRVGLAGVEVSCSPVSHRVVVVSAPPAAAQWLRLDLPGLTAAVRAVPGVDEATTVRVRRDDVT